MVLYQLLQIYAVYWLCDPTRLISFELTFTILQGYWNFNVVDVTSNVTDVTPWQRRQISFSVCLLQKLPQYFRALHHQETEETSWTIWPYNIPRSYDYWLVNLFVGTLKIWLKLWYYSLSVYVMLRSKTSEEQARA